MYALTYCYQCNKNILSCLNAHVLERKSQSVIFIVSHGASMPDAMTSPLRGLLATVVRGNQLSLQTAHRASQRHIESDSVAES